MKILLVLLLWKVQHECSKHIKGNLQVLLNCVTPAPSVTSEKSLYPQELFLDPHNWGCLWTDFNSFSLLFLPTQVINISYSIKTIGIWIKKNKIKSDFSPKYSSGEKIEKKSKKGVFKYMKFHGYLQPTFLATLNQQVLVQLSEGWASWRSWKGPAEGSKVPDSWACRGTQEVWELLWQVGFPLGQWFLKFVAC